MRRLRRIHGHRRGQRWLSHSPSLVLTQVEESNGTRDFKALHKTAVETHTHTTHRYKLFFSLLLFLLLKGCFYTKSDNVFVTYS